MSHTLEYRSNNQLYAFFKFHCKSVLVEYKSQGISPKSGVYVADWTV